MIWINSSSFTSVRLPQKPLEQFVEAFSDHCRPFIISIGICTVFNSVNICLSCTFRKLTLLLRARYSFSTHCEIEKEQIQSVYYVL